MHYLTPKLAAQGRRRQLEASAALDHVGAETDKVLGKAWDKLMRIIRTQPHGFLAYHATLEALQDLLPTIESTVTAGLSRVAEQAHASAAASMMRTLPARYLRAAAARRRAGLHLFESRRLLEAPGLLTLDPLGITSVLDEPPPAPTDARTWIEQLLFPPPDRIDVFRIVRNLQIEGQTWEQRLRGEISTRFSPAILAGIISRGYAAGLDQKQIARNLLPAVDGIRFSAKRLARTYGAAVAHDQQMKVSRALGDFVIGYTIHAVVGNPYSRWWHVARSGTQYFARPQNGQKGYAQMPHPPREAEDPRERPPKTPPIAWNCLCFLVPLLRPV